MSRYCVPNVRIESVRDLGEAEGRRSRRFFGEGVFLRLHSISHYLKCALSIDKTITRSR